MSDRLGRMILVLTKRMAIFCKKCATCGEIDATANRIIHSKRGTVRPPLPLTIPEEYFPIISMICPGFLLPAREPLKRRLVARKAHTNHPTLGGQQPALWPTWESTSTYPSFDLASIVISK